MLIPGFRRSRALSCRPPPRPARALFFLLAPLLGYAGAALAAGTATLPVNAALLSKSNCKFRGSTTVALAFGNIDPSSNTSALASASLTIRCTGSPATATFSLSHDSGLHAATPGSKRMKHATLNEFLPYTLSLTPSSGTVAKGVDLAIAVGGSVAPAAFQNAAAGNYADTVVVTLTP